MTTRKLVNLMLKSSNYNPYTGMLSEKGNLIAAIELAKLFKHFADDGQTEEAINTSSEQWEEVITKLKSKQK